MTSYTREQNTHRGIHRMHSSEDGSPALSEGNLKIASFPHERNTRRSMHRMHRSEDGSPALPALRKTFISIHARSALAKTSFFAMALMFAIANGAAEQEVLLQRAQINASSFKAIKSACGMGKTQSRVFEFATRNDNDAPILAYCKTGLGDCKGFIDNVNAISAKANKGSNEVTYTITGQCWKYDASQKNVSSNKGMFSQHTKLTFKRIFPAPVLVRASDSDELDLVENDCCPQHVSLLENLKAHFGEEVKFDKQSQGLLDYRSESIKEAEEWAEEQEQAKAAAEAERLRGMAELRAEFTQLTGCEVDKVAPVFGDTTTTRRRLVSPILVLRKRIDSCNLQTTHELK